MRSIRVSKNPGDVPVQGVSFGRDELRGDGQEQRQPRQMAPVAHGLCILLLRQLGKNNTMRRQQRLIREEGWKGWAERGTRGDEIKTRKMGIKNRVIRCCTSCRTANPHLQGRSPQEQGAISFRHFFRLFFSSR
jgi:hypothetical protein